MKASLHLFRTCAGQRRSSEDSVVHSTGMTISAHKPLVRQNAVSKSAAQVKGQGSSQVCSSLPHALSTLALYLCSGASFERTVCYTESFVLFSVWEAMQQSATVAMYRSDHGCAPERIKNRLPTIYYTFKTSVHWIGVCSHSYWCVVLVKKKRMLFAWPAKGVILYCWSSTDF